MIIRTAMLLILLRFTRLRLEEPRLTKSPRRNRAPEAPATCVPQIAAAADNRDKVVKGDILEAVTMLVR